jgi:excisionase family DNA binding protein
MNADGMMSVQDVADRLRVSDRSVRRWIHENLLQAHRFGRAVRISEADFMEFVSDARSMRTSERAQKKCQLNQRYARRS